MLDRGEIVRPILKETALTFAGWRGQTARARCDECLIGTRAHTHTHTHKSNQLLCLITKSSAVQTRASIKGFIEELHRAQARTREVALMTTD